MQTSDTTLLRYGTRRTEDRIRLLSTVARKVVTGRNLTSSVCLHIDTPLARALRALLGEGLELSEQM